MFVGRDQRERGATLVEAALVIPLFFALVFGVIEGGTLWFHRSAVDEMSVVAARVASASANDSTSDFSILQAVRNATADTSAITAVVVFRASNPDDKMPAACATSSVVNSAVTRGCNRYTAADLTKPQSSFGCGRGAIDTAWCPTTRKSALSGVNGPPDYIGVYVQGTFHTATSLFGKNWSFSSTTVNLIEPRTST